LQFWLQSFYFHENQISTFALFFCAAAGYYKIRIETKPHIATISFILFCSESCPLRTKMRTPVHLSLGSNKKDEMLSTRIPSAGNAIPLSRNVNYWMKSFPSGCRATKCLGEHETIYMHEFHLSTCTTWVYNMLISLLWRKQNKVTKLEWISEHSINCRGNAQWQFRCTASECVGMCETGTLKLGIGNLFHFVCQPESLLLLNSMQCGMLQYPPKLSAHPPFLTWA
jgi:hypothetical protein